MNAVGSYKDRYLEEASYWSSQLISEHAASYALSKICHSYAVEFDSELTKQLIEKTSRAYRTEINDILLSALSYTLSTHLGRPDVWICLEGHGREVIDDETDVSRTVGWFTIQYPVCLRVKESLGESIQHIKETLRAIPRKGIGFSCFYPDVTSPGVTFNYLGQFDGATSDWQVVRESSGRSVAVENSKPCYLTMNGAVIEGKLYFQLDSFTSEETVEALSRSFKEYLTKIVSHCVSQDRTFSTMRRNNRLKHLKLFLIHDVFGHSSNLFHNLIPYLTEKNISCIDHPYFKDSSFLFSSFQGMISYYFSEIKKQQPDGPYFLGGWSFGGMVAFELARRLSDSGDQIAFIIMFDSFINETSVEERSDYFSRNLQTRAEESHSEVQEYLCKPYENNHAILKDFHVSDYSASKVVLITSESTEEEINLKKSFWERNVTCFETVNTTMSHENFFDKDHAKDSALIINSIFRKYKENQAAFIIQEFFKKRVSK